MAGVLGVGQALGPQGYTPLCRVRVWGARAQSPGTRRGWWVETLGLPEGQSRLHEAGGGLSATLSPESHLE